MANWSPNPGGPESTRRRSQRVILSIGVTVSSEETRRKEDAFEEQTRTLVVNAHGGLVEISAKVQKGQMLRLRNRATNEMRLCKVAYIGPVSGDKAQIGVEFTTPAPEFWHIAFPPEDWPAPEREPAGRAKK